MIKFDSLLVDKSNSEVDYNDELHKYWTKNSSDPCISVTTLIHQFQTFDEDFWSAYKTIEIILTPTNFGEAKKELLLTKKFNNEILDKYNIPLDVFKEKRIFLLKEWEEKRERSCIRGTAFHRAQELLHLSGQTKEIQHLNLGGKFNTNISNKLEPHSKGVYPELLLSRISPDGKLRIAGQADLVIIDDLDVYILDYKTSKTIDTKSFFDKRLRKSTTMKYPLNNLQDTNFWHYSLQLSTYAWMIQKINPEFNIKLLMLIHFDHDNNITNYECDYLKNDVERMLAFHKNQVEHQEFAKSIEKISF